MVLGWVTGPAFTAEMKFETHRSEVSRLAFIANITRVSILRLTLI
jgi:hypothetical protein